MKTNLTLRVDADLAREAKILAATRNTSVSRLLSRELEALVRREKSYDQAMLRALARMDGCRDLQWTPGEDRADLHER